MSAPSSSPCPTPPTALSATQTMHKSTQVPTRLTFPSSCHSAHATQLITLYSFHPAHATLLDLVLLSSCSSAHAVELMPLSSHHPTHATMLVLLSSCHSAHVTQLMPLNLCHSAHTTLPMQLHLRNCTHATQLMPLCSSHSSLQGEEPSLRVGVPNQMPTMRAAKSVPAKPTTCKHCHECCCAMTTAFHTQPGGG